MSKTNEAQGAYKRNTEYVWQIKHKSRRKYQDNYASENLEEVIFFAEKNAHPNLKTRIMKRTIKEDIVK